MKVTLYRDLTILFIMLAMVTHSSAADEMLGEDEPVSDHKGDVVEEPTTSKTTGLQTDETSELITTGSPNTAPSPPTSCNVAITMTCFVEDAQGTKTNCKNMIPKPDDECVKEVKYTYIVTNNGDYIENIMSLDRTRDGEVKDLSDFLDVHETPLGHFGIASETDTLDFCMPRNVTTTVGIQSEQDFGVGDLTCSDQDTHSFPIHIMCDVDVKIDCFADEARDFQVPCNQFKPNLSGIRKSSCEHALKYVYTVTNSGSGSEAVSGITTVMQDGTKKNILPGPFDLEPDETMEFTDVMIVDYCENDFPNGMNTSIEVMANVLSEGSTTCSGVDEYFLNLPEPCNLNINPSIRCTTLDMLGSEVSCLDYISGIDDFTDPAQCMKAVKYEITLINQGLSCMDIESATGRLEGRSPVGITLEGNNASLCPNKNVDVVHYTEQNMCDDDLDSAMIVEVNGGPAESCGGFGTLNYLPVPKSIEDSQVELSLSCSDQDGNECVVAQDQQQCDSHPTYLDLKFTGKPCNASANDLGPFFTCYDFDPMQDVSEVYITIGSKEDGVYFEAPVTKGKMVRLGDEYRKLPADLVLNIQAGRNGSLLQKMKFRASCTEPISTRNVFGSLTLLGFGDGEKTVVATENEFEIQYEVKNVGETTVLLEGMLISVNDEEISRVSIGGSYQLPAGATHRGSETVEISASATDVKAGVTVVVIAESLSAIKSNAQERIDIDVMLSPTPRPYHGGKASKGSKGKGKGSKSTKVPKSAKGGYSHGKSSDDGIVSSVVGSVTSSTGAPTKAPSTSPTGSPIKAALTSTSPTRAPTKAPSTSPIEAPTELTAEPTKEPTASFDLMNCNSYTLLWAVEFAENVECTDAKSLVEIGSITCDSLCPVDCLICDFCLKRVLDCETDASTTNP